MYSIKQVRDDIRRYIGFMAERNNSQLDPDWITQAVLNEHADITGPDSDFYLCCSRQTVRHEARQIINRLEWDQEKDAQIVLEGFERLQKYYMTERSGQRVAVRIDLMTQDELESKLREHEARLAAEEVHVQELRRYIDQRFIAAV